MIWLMVIARNITMGIAWHRFTAWFNIYYKRESDGSTALGAMKPLTSDGKADHPRRHRRPRRGLRARRRQGRGLLVEGHPRLHHLHRVRPLPVAVPRLEHREAALAQAPDHRAARPRVRQGTTASRPTPSAQLVGVGSKGESAGARHRRPRLLLQPRGRRLRHRRGRAVELHLVRRLRPAVPRRHRARRPHHGHAALPAAGGVQLPGRAQPALQGPGEQGQPVEHVAHRADGLGQGPGVRRPGRRGGPRVPRVGRLAVLGRLRGGVRGPRQEDDPRGRRAARHGRHLLRRARQRRDLHRRPGPSRRQRVRLPGPGPAERRDLQGVQGQEGRLDLRPLLQHAQERVQGLRHRARGRAPHPAAQPPRARGQADARSRTARAPRSARSPTTTRATSVATTRSTRRRASCSRCCPAPRSSRWSATPSTPSAAAPVARACGWRRTSASGST